MRVLPFVLLLVAAWACSRNGKPAPTDPQPRVPAGDPAPPPARVEAGAARLVVSLQRNSPGHMSAISEYCILGEDGRTGVFHEGLPYRLGGVNVRPGAKVAGELEKAPALLVTAVLRPDMSSVLTRTDRPCSRDGVIMAQARGDWGTPECGQGLPCFTSLAALAKFSYWELLEARNFEGLSVTPGADGASLEVRFKNVFGVAQEAQELVAHYEGGPGKPMPRFLKHPVPALVQGQEHVVTVPLVVDEDEKPLPVQPDSRRGRFYDLASLDWKGRLLDGATEIQVQVSHFVYRQYREKNPSK